MQTRSVENVSPKEQIFLHYIELGWSFLWKRANSRILKLKEINPHRSIVKTVFLKNKNADFLKNGAATEAQARLWKKKWWEKSLKAHTEAKPQLHSVSQHITPVIGVTEDELIYCFNKPVKSLYQ